MINEIKMQLELFTENQAFCQTDVSSSVCIRIISKKLGMTGKNISFLQESFFGLQPGEKVKQIGDGRENGTIRTDFFDYPLKYVGAIICQFSKPEKMFAFELPDKHGEDNIYFLYGSTESEIFTEAVFSMKDRVTKKPSGYMRFYSPVFVKTDC